MFGDNVLTRFHDVHHFYAAEAWDPVGLHIGAFLGPTIVGLIRASPYGRCHVCAVVDPSTPPSDPILARDWVFECEVLRSHEGYADHAWISRVAVEPQLHGRGLGKALVLRAVEELTRLGSGTVLLECLATREGFYLSCGFTRAAEVPDPYANASYLMRVDVP